MKQLPLPAFDPIEVFLECVADVKDETLQNRYIENQGHIEEAIAVFTTEAANHTLCKLPRVPRGQNNRIVAGTLSKNDLTKLYSKYMVGSTGSARTIYDDIFVTANGKCPFCGGIGHVKTLDHYLPKANFPLYSVLPANLVPCCRDCNTGLGATFATAPEEQTIHPYFDEDHFFSERWVVATIMQTDPVTAQFKAEPPVGWDQIDKQRAESHFQEYDLPARFSVEAAAEIAMLTDLRRTALRDMPADTFSNILRGNANSGTLPINGWKRTTYSALADVHWFCAEI